jgi:hypothetical protein
VKRLVLVASMGAMLAALLCAGVAAAFVLPSGHGQKCLARSAKTHAVKNRAAKTCKTVKKNAAKKPKAAHDTTHRPTTTTHTTTTTTHTTTTSTNTTTTTTGTTTTTEDEDNDDACDDLDDATATTTTATTCTDQGDDDQGDEDQGEDDDGGGGDD